MGALLKNISTLLLCTVLSLSVSSCSFTGNRTVENENKPNTDELAETDNSITIGVVELDMYNPLTSESVTAKNMLSFIFEPLFVIDEEGEAEGVLATGYQLAPDGKSIRVNLKQNVLWHDGNLFTADDVVYTINALMNTDTDYAELVSDVVSARKDDADTVTVIFDRSVPDPAALLSFPVIKNNSMNTDFKPVGTGPFFMDYDKLSAYGAYHGDKPKLESVNIKSVPDNDKFISLFNASVIDVADSDILDMNQYMPRSNAQVHDYLSNELVFVGFNVNDEVFRFPEARRSVSAIVDRRDIVSHIYFSRAEAVNYPINPTQSIYPADKGRIDKDKGRAEKELKDAGWKKDSRGVYFFANNAGMTYFSVDILVNSDDKERLKVASKISDVMTDMGMRNSITTCSGAEFKERIMYGNYDMFIGKTKLLPNNDLSSLLSTGNEMNYSDSETDILLSQIGTLTKEEDKDAVYRKLLEKISSDCPIAPVCFLKESLVTSAKLKSGVTPSMSGVISRTERWSVNE